MLVSVLNLVELSNLGIADTGVKMIFNPRRWVFRLEGNLCVMEGFLLLQMYSFG